MTLLHPTPQFSHLFFDVALSPIAINANFWDGPCMCTHNLIRSQLQKHFHRVSFFFSFLNPSEALSVPSLSVKDAERRFGGRRKIKTGWIDSLISGAATAVAVSQTQRQREGGNGRGVLTNINAGLKLQYICSTDQNAQIPWNIKQSIIFR